MPGILLAINISPGGVPKLPVPQAMITTDGIVGDRQKDRKHHGGPDRAISVLAMSVIRELQAHGHSIIPGSTGDNLTIDGLSAEELVPGTRLHLGKDPATAVELELTKWLEPCSKIAASFSKRQIAVFAHETNACRSRIGARVLRGGLVTTGDRVELIKSG